MGGTTADLALAILRCCTQSTHFRIKVYDYEFACSTSVVIDIFTFLRDFAVDEYMGVTSCQV